MPPRRRSSPSARATSRSDLDCERRALALAADGTLRLGVVADTHSRPHPATAERLRALAPHAILHGGDIGALEVLDELAAVAPVIAVRGNIDSPSSRLPELVVVEVTAPVPEGPAAAGRQAPAVVLKILLVHIAVAGPYLRADIAARARAEGARLVVCGHSHVPFIGQHRGVAVFNPGSVGPRRFHLPIALGRVDVSDGTLTCAHIDCETGGPWLPP